jgi:hypothetical protein
MGRMLNGFVVLMLANVVHWIASAGTGATHLVCCCCCAHGAPHVAAVLVCLVWCDDEAADRHCCFALFAVEQLLVNVPQCCRARVWSWYCSWIWWSREDTAFIQRSRSQPQSGAVSQFSVSYSTSCPFSLFVRDRDAAHIALLVGIACQSRFTVLQLHVSAGRPP